jgi:alkylation response protein AidB-like acyl-CoA dehydrogenase
VDFRPTALHRELAAGTREVLDKHCPAEAVRDGLAAEVWAALVELGLPGALATGDLAGSDLTISDLLPALVETGRVAVPVPIVETALVAVPLLLDAGREDLVEGIVAGEVVVTAAPAGEPVPWAGFATHALLLHDGAAQLVADSLIDDVPAVDTSRPLAKVSSTANLFDADGRAARLRGALGAAAQLIGLAERQLEMTVAHVTGRHQFGVPVGSFQAVQHRLADALLELRFAEPAVRAAGLRVDTADGERAVALAKALASDAADTVSRAALQCHGAIGYTDEYDLQLYAKRGWALAASWGTADFHRAAYGSALGLPPGGSP